MTSKKEIKKVIRSIPLPPDYFSMLVQQAGADTRGGGRRGALREWPGGATIWLIHCQNSLKTRLKYIKITLKFDFYTKSGSGPHRIFSEGARKLTKTQIISEGGQEGPGGATNLPGTDILPPTLEKTCIRAWQPIYVWFHH